ncbi:hypothetical protein FGW37_10995 [Streptomyces rectiverticillatus]|uniref:hypothetical protein n=1 Tax=Streptomyces rectiverticillatus TaxID=173860 RepID=UPI0015C37C3D|nr:hypothetical protein [Streptomyces rectiverticillatus]QLE72061.1 hypothetical protein FGW37_10995 [Streptomyces rectiverticillatus]
MSKQQAGLYEPLPAAPRSYARPGGPSGYGAAVWPPPAPPPIPPHRRGKAKLVVGVAIGSLITMCTLMGGFLILTGGGSSAHGGTRYRLTAPERVGDFRKDAPVDRTFRADHLERLRRLGVRDVGSVTAGYSSGSGMPMLMYSGVWGEVKDPGRAVDGMFAAMAEDARERPVQQGGAREQIEGSPERVSPRGLEGAGAVMKCQSVHFTPENDTAPGLTLPYCVWADRSTVGVVGAALGEGAGITEAAEATGELRRAARTPR